MFPGTSFAALDKGPTHEVYKGSSCTVRIDWTRTGAVRYKYSGQVDGSCADLVIRRLEAMTRTCPSIIVFHDLWDASGMDTKFRTEVADWAKRHAGVLASVNVLAQSKIVSMSVSIWGLAGFVVYSKRPEFDIQCKKAGLPSI